MEIRRLPPTDDALWRFATDLWLPYHRDLADAADAHALADEPDEWFVERNVAFTRDRLAEDGFRGWVVVTATDADGDPDDRDNDSDDRDNDPADRDGSEDTGVDPATAPLTDPRLDLVGILFTSVDACPDVFDRPDRLVIGELYVAEPYRGTGLADRLLERALVDAREQDCGQLRLDVDVDNERALAFYEKCGFEPYRKQLVRSIE